MENGRIGTLHLTGKDAVNFAHSFFCPSIEEINEHDAVRSRISETVSLKRNEHGFSAEISDLDLSFLDKENTEEQVSVTVTVSVKTQKMVFNSTDVSNLSAHMYVSKSKTGYISCKTSKITRFAA